MSLLLRPDIAPSKAPMLTLVAALSTAKGIMDCMNESAELPVQIKWPNDIIINGKKMVGILTEMSTQIDYINHVTVGTGINVNMESFPKELSDRATSLRMECGHIVKRAPIIAAVMKSMEKYYEIFMETQDMTGLLEEYNKLLVNRGKEVVILGEQEKYQAHALGINKEGELLVRRDDGTEEAIFAGEVSVRGVYGYV